MTDGVASESLPLVGTTWRLSWIAAGEVVSSVLADTEITASLDEEGSTIAGSAGCNRYTGTFTTGGDGSLVLSPLATTRMLCPDDVMAQESAFLRAMEHVATFEVDGTQLRLLDPAGSVLLVFAGEARSE